MQREVVLRVMIKVVIHLVLILRKENKWNLERERAKSEKQSSYLESTQTQRQNIYIYSTKVR